MGLVQVGMLTLHALSFANPLQVLLLQEKSDKVEEENKFLAIALDDLQDSSSRLEAENRALKMGASPAPLSGLSGGGNLAKVSEIAAEFGSRVFRFTPVPYSNIRPNIAALDVEIIPNGAENSLFAEATISLRSSLLRSWYLSSLCCGLFLVHLVAFARFHQLYWRSRSACFCNSTEIMIAVEPGIKSMKTPGTL